MRYPIASENNNNDDWTIAEVVNYQWSWKETRIALADLIFGPFDFWFSEMFGAKQKSSPTSTTTARGDHHHHNHHHNNTTTTTNEHQIVQQHSSSDTTCRFNNVNNITTALTKSITPPNAITTYKPPQPSLVALQSFDLASDDDVWVERTYFDKKNRPISFYRSYRTGKCVLSEPPSGAQAIVHRRDLESAPPAIQLFAVEQLDRRSLMDLTKQIRMNQKGETWRRN